MIVKSSYISSTTNISNCSAKNSLLLSRKNVSRMQTSVISEKLAIFSFLGDAATMHQTSLIAEVRQIIVECVYVISGLRAHKLPLVSQTALMEA